MGTSSIVGGERAAQQADGRDDDVLGPSDTSDSGSDIQGATPIIGNSDTDSGGTGERAGAVPEGVRDGADIAPDRIASSKDALDGAVSIEDDDDSVEALADESDDDDDEADDEA